MEPEKVRVGTITDLDQIMSLAMLMHEEIGISAMSTEKLLPEIYSALTMSRGLMGVIGEPGERIQGCILLKIGKLFYSDEDILEEKGLFIHPEFRRRPYHGAARELCEFAKKTSDQLEMPLLIGIQNDVRTKGKIRLYERQFGPQIGAFFLHRPGA